LPWEPVQLPAEVKKEKTSEPRREADAETTDKPSQESS
jgi:hypothetical protein